MTLDPTRSILFVTDHGTILEKARLLYLLMDMPPSPEAYQKLINSQNPDGGFPSRPRPGSQSAVDSTLTALWQFDELGLLEGASARRALDFLEAMQRPDGGLDENPDLPQHDLPPWIVPGSLNTRLYLTAYAAYWLALTGRAQHPGFPGALDFLAAHQAENGQMPGYLHTNWLAAAAFGLAELAGLSGYAHPYAQGLAFLQAHPFSEWADSQVAWAIDCLSRLGLNAQQPFIASALAELQRRQAPDGSWASEDGPAFAASATVGAIKVLKHYGLVGELD